MDIILKDIIKKVINSYDAFPSMESVRESLSQEIVEEVIGYLSSQKKCINEISIELAFDEESGKPIAIKINKETCKL